MEGLTEDECKTLREEMQLQSRSNMNISPPNPVSQVLGHSKSPVSPSLKTSNESQVKASQKRSATQTDVQDTRHSPKIHVTNSYYLSHTATNGMGTSPMSGQSSDASSSNVPTNNPQQNPQQQQQEQQQDNVYMYQNSVFYGNSPNQTNSDTDPGLPPYLLTPQAAAPPIPYHPHPPLKRWPNDYTVSELSSGFHAMDLLISQSPTGASMTQRTAFERVFGSRYVKSTVCRHRAVWRKAPRMLREQFEQMGTDDRACWGEFVRRVENRPPGKGATMDMLSSPQSANLGYHEQHDTPDDEEVHNQEVIGAMQNQGRPSPDIPNLDI